MNRSEFWTINRTKGKCSKDKNVKVKTKTVVGNVMKSDLWWMSVSEEDARKINKRHIGMCRHCHINKKTNYKRIRIL